MDEKIEEEGLRHIEHIEREVGEIKSRTPGSWRAFVNGVMQGMGAIVGSILAVALLGWVLSIFGIIPGLDQLADYLKDLMGNIRRS